MNEVTAENEHSDEAPNSTTVSPAETQPVAPKRTAEDDAHSHSLIQELMASEAKRAEDEARQAEADRIAEDARRAEDARLAEEERAAEAARQAEEASRRTEEARLEEQARLEEHTRLEEEARAEEEAQRARAARVAAAALAAQAAENPEVEDDHCAPAGAITDAAPVMPRRILAEKTDRPKQPRTWDTPSDHEMSRKSRRIWQAAIYGGLIAVPAAFFALSPFGPRDTVGHHVSAMGCQFAELFDMQNAEIGTPGYHESLDADANGIACEEKKRTRISMGGGGSRFVRP